MNQIMGVDLQRKRRSYSYHNDVGSHEKKSQEVKDEAKSMIRARVNGTGGNGAI
jgi:hypothetical protein